MRSGCSQGLSISVSRAAQGGEQCLDIVELVARDTRG